MIKSNLETKTLVYLADLTHTGHVICSEIFPLSVGVVGAYMKTQMPDDIDVELFKFPEDLSQALEKKMPRVIGFTIYSWNTNIAYDSAARIKKKYPDVIIVFGGPNYGITDEEMDIFWKRYPAVDFYIVYEGEVAMTLLVKLLKAYDFDVDRLKHSDEKLYNCHYLKDGKIVTVDHVERIRDAEEIPSPYLMGLMDKFFAHNLIPLTFTTRGCPFRCTYCSEGSKYYQKVIQKTKFEEELIYIAERVTRTTSLYLSDANFGMWKEDVAKAEAISRIQQKYGYPKVLLVATGKNQKARVLEVAKILKGAMFISTALQSTDKEVLKNVNRDNLTLPDLTELTQNTKEAGENTYTELILALPGDTFEKHKKSLKDTVESGQGVVRMYQLIMLMQTELNVPENVRKFQMQKKYRITPRSYGRYKVFGESFVSVEAEAICVATNTLSHEEYLDCREMDLTVEILHNGSPFIAFWYLCQWLGFSWFDFLMMFHNKRKEYGDKIKNLYETFREDSMKGYWDTYEDLQNTVINNFDKYVEDTDGTNEMSKGKAIAFFHCETELHDILTENMKQILEEHGQWDSGMELYLEELKMFCQLRKSNVFDFDKTMQGEFNFDFITLMNTYTGVDPRKFKLSKPVTYDFYIDEKQKAIFCSHLDRYGSDSIDGLGRILMRSRMEDLFRNVREAQT
jgi:radical SAM superfamily enzyme YgiQ (UPF0313 family)